MTQCVLCSTPLTEANPGIVILGKFICNGCENKIINLTWDDPDYDIYKRGLKKIWRCSKA